MRLGTVTYNMAKDWDLPTLVRNLREAGLEGVELRTTHKHGVEVDLTPEQRAEVRKQFQDSGIELAGLGSTFEYHSPDPAELERNITGTKAYVELAHDLACPGIKVRPNGLPRSVPAETTLKQIAAALHEVGEYAEGYGVQIRVEVHGPGTSQPSAMKRIMDLADHDNVYVCWNCNPSDLDRESTRQHPSIAKNFALLAHKISLVHMHDLFDEYPYAQLLGLLKGIGYEGYCLAEMADCDSQRDAIRIFRYYRALWQEMLLANGADKSK